MEKSKQGSNFNTINKIVILNKNIISFFVVQPHLLKEHKLSDSFFKQVLIKCLVTKYSLEMLT